MKIDTNSLIAQNPISNLSPAVLNEEPARKDGSGAPVSSPQEDTLQLSVDARNRSTAGSSASDDQPKAEVAAKTLSAPTVTRDPIKEEEKITSSGMAEEIANSTRQGILQNSVQSHFAVSQVRADAVARLLLK
jgi:predicted HTH transcriptional regulator